MTDRVAAQNLEAEAAVLGGVLLDNAALAPAAAILQPGDFYRPSHGKIFSAMTDLADRQQPIDVIILSDLLKANGTLEAVGGSAYLAELHDSTPTAVNIGHHARLVKDTAKRRAFLLATSEAAEATHSSDPLEEIFARLSSKISLLTSESEKGFQSIEAVLIETLKNIEQAAESGTPANAIPTGLTRIDESMGGFYRGELVIIGGRPGSGKTAFAGTVAVEAAKRGYPVAFVTAESPSREIVQRLLSAHANVENRNLRRAKLRDGDYSRIVASKDALSRLPIALLDGCRSWDLIKARVRAQQQKRELSLIVCDYVQLLSAPTANRERYLEVGRISSEAKALAIELNAAFVPLAQLNREVENRSEKRPQLSDLRESGNLEQDADVVGLLYRPSKYDQSKPRDLVELDIAKNRNGAVGTLPLHFTEETTWFSDWTA